MKAVTMRFVASAAVAICAAVLGACGTGGTHISTTPATVPSSPATALVRLSFIVPKKSAASTARAKQYVSTSTQSLTITVTPAGGTARAPIFVACTATCTATFQAPVGNDAVALEITDGPNGTGNQLSLSTTNVTVVANASNVFNLTANPVVSSVAAELGSVPASTATTSGGVAADIPVTVNAMDADGNIIVGPGNYVDVNGTPVTLTLSVTNAQAGGTGTAVLNGNTTFTAPGAAMPTVHYDGKWLEDATVSVTASSAAVTSLPGAVLTSRAHAVEYQAAGGPVGITAGPDGNIWFTEFLGHSVGKIATDGTGYAAYSCASCNAFDSLYFITVGPDHNLWSVDYFGEEAYSITTGGSFTPVAATFSLPISIVPGPDGNLWYSGLSAIGKISTAGMINNYQTTDSIGGITFGADGNLWYIDATTNIIGVMNTAGSILATYPISTAPGIYSNGIAAGPDGNIWFTNYGSNLIEKITPSGTITPYALQPGAGPRDIVAGPDGDLWFTETGTSSIGRIGTNGDLTEYGAADGITIGSVPLGICVGPDGNIWFTEFGGTNKIGKITL